MDPTNIKLTDISYFAAQSSSTGHSWMHDALKIEIGGENYELFSRSKAKGMGGRLSSLGYQGGAGPATSVLAKSEASKILTNTKFSQDENQVLFFYEGGAFEFQLCMELAHKLKKGRVWFNFHDAIFWIEACGQQSEFLGFLESLNSPIVRDRVVFSAESSELASLLSSTFGFPCHAFPLYTTLPQQLGKLPKATPPWESRQIDLLLIVGDFEMSSKVSQYVQAAKSAIGHNASIHVHWSARDFEAVGKLRNLEISQTFGQISPEEYASQLTNSKYTLLLYPTHRYKHKSSGRIEDAILCGSVPIVPAKTSLVSQNSRSLPSFEHPRDLVEVMKHLTVPKLEAVSAKAFLDKIRPILTEPGLASGDNHRFRTSIPKLRFPSPNKRKRFIDKLSVWRIRLGVPNGMIKAPRTLYRLTRQSWMNKVN